MQKNDEKIEKFLQYASLGTAKKEEVTEAIEKITSRMNDTNSEIVLIEDFFKSVSNKNPEGLKDTEKIKELALSYGIEPDSIDHIEEYREINTRLLSYLTELQRISNTMYKSFDKALCFSNIRYLMKDSDVKIGQIEREAGFRLGYLARLEKPDNTTEPSIEFIATAAKMLKVSIDTLISVNLSEMTPTEKYIQSFLDKVKADTLADKLDWEVEKSDDLNGMESDQDGYVEHPLFDYETFYEESECGYPNQVTRIIFKSNSFGTNTIISGKCFNLRLKNGVYLYLMNIQKNIYTSGDTNTMAKEIWMYTPDLGSQLLVTNKQKSLLNPMVDVLYQTVNERMKHPKLKREVQNAIEAFMNDDLEDDPIDDNGLPFNF